MNRKTCTQVQIKDATKGQVTALFARFNSKDSDGDVTLPGAFEDGAHVVISAYNHESWNGALPVGYGTLRQTKDAAYMDGQFLMDTTHGRDAFLTVKALAERGLGEWSYGYDPIEYKFGTWGDNEDQVRFLVKQHVFEVSPVLRGAGVDTQTVSAKGKGSESTMPPTTQNSEGFGVALKRHETKTSRDPWNARDVLASLPEGDDAIAALRAAHAWVDPTADPGTKAAYRVLHHDADGSANVRACLIEIAYLNGAGKSGVPASERKAVYDHLAGHLEDDEFDVPELYDGRHGAVKLADEMIAAVAALESVCNRATDVVALRSRKGKGLASTSALILGWLLDSERKMRALVDSPNEDAAREFARYVAMTRGMQP